MENKARTATLLRLFTVTLEVLAHAVGQEEIKCKIIGRRDSKLSLLTFTIIMSAFIERKTKPQQNLNVCRTINLKINVILLHWQ